MERDRPRPPRRRRRRAAAAVAVAPGSPGDSSPPPASPSGSACDAVASVVPVRSMRGSRLRRSFAVGPNTSAASLTRSATCVPRMVFGPLPASGEASAPDVPPAWEGRPRPRPLLLRRRRACEVLLVPSPFPPRSASFTSGGPEGSAGAVATSFTSSVNGPNPFVSRRARPATTERCGERRTTANARRSAGARSRELHPGPRSIRPVKRTRVIVHGNTSLRPSGARLLALRTRPRPGTAGCLPQHRGCLPATASSAGAANREVQQQHRHPSDGGFTTSRIPRGPQKPRSYCERMWMLWSRPSPMRSAISALPP